MNIGHWTVDHDSAIDGILNFHTASRVEQVVTDVADYVSYYMGIFIDWQIFFLKKDILHWS